MTISNNNYAINKCFLPQESTVIYTYIVGGFCIVIWFLLPWSLFSSPGSRSRSNKTLWHQEWSRQVVIKNQWSQQSITQFFMGEKPGVHGKLYMNDGVEPIWSQDRLLLCSGSGITMQHFATALQSAQNTCMMCINFPHFRFLLGHYSSNIVNLWKGPQLN